MVVAEELNITFLPEEGTEWPWFHVYEILARLLEWSSLPHLDSEKFA
jgi:hypothetical protein